MFLGKILSGDLNLRRKWMPFLMKCPSCGRRFDVKLLGKSLMDDERESETVSKSMLVPGARGMNVSTETPIQVTSVVTSQRKAYELSYECRSCGHKWSEKIIKVRQS